MKYLAFTLLLAAAVPALAQQTPPAPPAPPSQPDMPAPATPDTVARTPLSASPAPADGPRAAQGDSSANDAASREGGGLAPPPPPPPPPGATVIAEPSPSPSQAFPPPAPLDHYPVCKAHQFDKCMEPGAHHGGHRKR